MALYHDPTTPRARPDLVGDLLTIPATAVQHQQENQATSVLAWLADRSAPFARRLVQLFLDAEGPAAAAPVIGARTQLSLPQAGGSTVFPDLSLDGAGRTFQILVEVKIDAAFHSHTAPDGSEIHQVDLYRQIWQAMPPAGEAVVRAVSTLTRLGGQSAPDFASLRGRDVAWREVSAVLNDLTASSLLEPEVTLVAMSFARAIDTRIAPKPPSPDLLQAFFVTYRPTVAAIAARLVEALGAVPASGGSGADYVGSRVRLTDRLGTPLFVRVYAAPAGGRLNVAGWGDVVIAVLERNSDGNMDLASYDAVTVAGFPRLKDLDSFWMHRAVWPADEDATAIAHDLVHRIQATQLL